MALNAEWKDRLKSWTKALREHFFQRLGVVEFEGFTTFDKLTADEAQQGNFAPMPAGATWGEKFLYAWFRGQITTPDEAAGTKFVLQHALGGAGGLVFVNGEARGHLANDVDEPFVLSLEGQIGETFDLLIEVYAGNQPMPISPGPVAFGKRTVPEEDTLNTNTIGDTTFGVWRQEAYQLWMDVTTIQSMLQHLPAESLRAAELSQGLKDFTLTADPELPTDEMYSSFVDAREVLAPLMAKTNGPSTPTFHVFGHGHLDIAWLWPLAETERKIARTLAHQLSLVEEFPEHRFLQPQTHLYWMLKNDYPELFKRVKRAIAAGSIIADGAVWAEPDTNMSSGESLIRQFMYGKRFYKDELGVDCEVLWLPDVFGYSGSLPQIMRGCGVKYFSSWKIFWNYHGGEDFPHHIFTWEGIDGSEVLVELVNGYGMGCIPDSTIRNWRDRATKDPRFDEQLHVFGWGDGGCGPSLNHIEYTRRQYDLEGCPKMKYSSLAESFAALEAKGPPPARFVGEMYFQCHRGVLTAQARTKLGNRRCEIALHEAEMWCVAAGAIEQGFEFPVEEMMDAWRAVMLNQFHDILPGSSIKRVHDEAEVAYANVIAITRGVAGEAIASLIDSEDGIIVFNSLSWDRSVLVIIPESWAGAVDADGNELPVQAADGERVFEVAVPSCGWTSVAEGKGIEPAGGDGVQADVNRLENELVRVQFDSVGRITSVIDKASGQEFAGGLCNEFKMFKDTPSQFDAWDIDSMYELQPVELGESAEVEVVASGELFAALQVTRQVNNSKFIQEITLRRGSRRVEFNTVIDWQEQHKLLKVGFATNIHANEAIHEIQFGHMSRPNHRSRQFDADRFEVAQQRWTALAEARRGAAVLNDCKYAVNVLGGTINLTLLRAPMGPDDLADRGRQEFTYAFYVWPGGALADSGVVREAAELNVPPTVAEGSAAGRSMFAVNADNVIIDTVKPAEDGSGDVIVRLYEAMRTTTACELTTSLPVESAVATDMLENPLADLGLADGAVSLDFRPFEVKTVRLKL